MSNVTYQMVYSNCQSECWSMSNIPESFWEIQAEESDSNHLDTFVYYQVILDNLGGTKKHCPKVSGGVFLEEGKETTSLTKKPNVHC